MIRIISNSVIILIVCYLFFYFALPGGMDFLEVVPIILFSTILFPIYINRFSKRKKSETVSFGMIFFIVMWVIMIIGNANYYLVLYIYPLYTPRIINTNIYWIIGMILFAEGYFLFKGKDNINADVIYPITNKIIIFILFLGVSGTIFLYLDLGFVPVLTGVRDYEIKTGGSLFGRLWGFNAFCSLLAFIYSLYVKKFSYLFISVFTLVSTLFLNQRMMLFTTLVAIFLVLWDYIKHKRLSFVLIGLGIFFYMLINSTFLSKRDAQLLEGSNVYKATDLSEFQSKTIFTTFNEYVQLNELMESKFNEFQYGNTLLNIPAAFFPAPVLSLFMIDKYKIQDNNSAKIYARYTNSKISDGIRTGILGEFYVNFGYIGILLMFFWGMLIKKLQLYSQDLAHNDFRYSISIMIFVFMLYALTGQIDGVASLAIQYLLFGYIVLKLWNYFNFPIIEHTAEIMT